jgi:hypothetical protein
MRRSWLLHTTALPLGDKRLSSYLPRRLYLEGSAAEPVALTGSEELVLGLRRQGTELK